MPLELEEQVARTEMGLSLDEYNALPGTRDWVDPNHPTFSKSDVIAIYRCRQLADSIRQDLSMPKKT